MIIRPRLRAPSAAALAALLIVAACTGSSGAPPIESAAIGASLPVAPTAAASALDSLASAPANVPTEAPSDPPPVVLTQTWATAPLVDVATGETFRIADLAGKVVIVETMAIWCSNCRAQQADVQIALDRLPADTVVFVVLDVDPNEEAASLAEYRVDNGFEGRYAIAGSDVARALAAEFGDQMLNPPATPMLFIGTDGTVTRTDFGPKSTDQIVTLAEAHGA